eukprot:scaffold61831_cov67-Phaeocystis_antarctica.AAC.1
MSSSSMRRYVTSTPSLYRKRGGLSLRPASSPRASFSLGLPGASASLGQSTARAALAGHRGPGIVGGL